MKKIVFTIIVAFTAMLIAAILLAGCEVGEFRNVKEAVVIADFHGENLAMDLHVGSDRAFNFRDVINHRCDSIKVKPGEVKYYTYGSDRAITLKVTEFKHIIEE